jgi:hypothetical protein
MHAPHNAEGHLPGLGESPISPRAARGVVVVKIPPIAGPLCGDDGDGCDRNCGFRGVQTHTTRPIPLRIAASASSDCSLWIASRPGKAISVCKIRLVLLAPTTERRRRYPQIGRRLEPRAPAKSSQRELRPEHDSAFSGRLRCGLLRDCTGRYWQTQTPATFKTGVHALSFSRP